jgi:hypothetical protein
MTDNNRGLEHGATVTFFGEVVKSRNGHLRKFSVFNTWIESLRYLRAVCIIKIALHISL